MYLNVILILIFYIDCNFERLYTYLIKEIFNYKGMLIENIIKFLYYIYR